MKLLRHPCILAIFYFVATMGFAQRPENMEVLFSRLRQYDSLQVKDYEADTVVTGVMCKLCLEYKNFNIDSAVYYCNEALRIATNRKYKMGMGLAYDQTALIYKQKGEYVEALVFHNKALEIYQSFKTDNPAFYKSQIMIKEGVVFNNLGIVYSYIGSSSNAMKAYLKALKIFEDLGDKSRTASALGNIGNMYQEQGKYDKAIEYYLRVLKIAKEIGNQKMMASCYSNIGYAYWQKKDNKTAIDNYLKAIQISESRGDKVLLSTTYTNMGIIYDEEKNYEKALEYYNKSLQLKIETDDKRGESTVLGNLGSLYLDRGMYAEAENYLSKAFGISNEIGDLNLQADQNIMFSELYSKTGDYKKALEYYQKGKSIKDSLVNESKIEELTAKTLTYEFEKKQDSIKAANERQNAINEANSKLAIAEANNKRLLAESQQKIQVANAQSKQIAAEADKEKTAIEAAQKIAISEADKKRTEAEAAQKIAASNAAVEKQKFIRNSIIGGSAALALIGFLGFINFRNKRRREKAELSQQVAETEMKALRAQMNPHFLFNALGSIQSFLLNNKSADANNYLLKFKELVRLVLENSRYKEVSLAEDMKALELYMQLESIRLQHPFSYQFHIDKSIDTEQAVIPPLILQPFVENAIWHGLQPRENEGGHIDISIQQTGGNLQCIVEDNGVGRNNKDVQTAAPFKKESLGIKLTEERLKIINELKKVKAYFNITDLFSANNTPCGTRVELMLPLL